MQSAPGSLAIDFSEGFAAKLRLLGAPKRTHNEHEHIRAEAKRLKSDWPDAWNHYKDGPFAHTKLDYFNLLWFFADKYCKHKVHVEELYHETLQNLTEDERQSFQDVHDKEQQFCMDNHLHFQDKSYHKILHALLRCVRHMHPENIRRVQELFVQESDLDTLKNGLQSCIEAEIKLGSSVLEAYDYRYLYCMTHNDNHLVGVLCRYLAKLPKEDVILLEWCGSWKNQLMFWYYSKGLGYHLLKYKESGENPGMYNILQFNGKKQFVWCGDETKTLSKTLQSLQAVDIHSFLKFKWGLQKESGFVYNQNLVSQTRIEECDDFLKHRVDEFLTRRQEFLDIMNYAPHHSKTYIAQLHEYRFKTKLSGAVNIPTLKLHACILGADKSWSQVARDGHDAAEDRRFHHARDTETYRGAMAPQSRSHRANRRDEEPEGSHGDERGGYHNNDSDPYESSNFDRDGRAVEGNGWKHSRRWNGWSEHDVDNADFHDRANEYWDENERGREYGFTDEGHWVDIYTPRNGERLIRQVWVQYGEGVAESSRYANGGGGQKAGRNETNGPKRARIYDNNH